MAGLEEQLCDAAWAGDLGELNRLLAAGADPASAARYGETALGLAACQGHVHCVQALLAAGADPDVFSPGQMMGRTVLMEAASHGQQAVVAALLEAGAQPALANSIGWAALSSAAYNGHVAVLRQLLAALPAEEQQESMAISVAAALIDGHVEAAQCLLLEGAAAPPEEVLAVLRRHPAPAAQPLYATVAARQPLTAGQWERVPSPCPGLGTALPAVLHRSGQEAAVLVRHLPPADRERLRAAALCLHRAQRQLSCQLPIPVVWRLLALAAAAG